MSEALKYALAITLFLFAAVVYFFGYYKASAVSVFAGIFFFALAIMHPNPPYEDDNF